MDYNKIEDSVFKKAMDIFRQSAVDFFGINAKIIAPAETEIKNIDINTSHTDYLFYTEDGNYLHFEFQTTDKKEDIKRFLYYDASLYYKEKRKVKTLVIYSSDIEKVEDFIDAGSINYSIDTFYMKNLDGDENINYIKNKIKNKEKLMPQDILALTLTPLMSGKNSRSNRAIESIKLAEEIENYENKIQCLSMLYALTEKFGDENSKKKLREVIVVTEIGRMILEEGMKEGMKEGIKEGELKGKSEMLIKLLSKKFKKIPKTYVEKIKTLPEYTIDIIATEIFDMEKVEDIEKYL